MLSNVETFFVRLLRGTVIATAMVSFLITILALIFALYAQFAPNPSVRIAEQIDRFRQATDPVKLIKEVFPSDAPIVKETAGSDNVAYEKGKRLDPEILQQFNKFLDGALGASFENASQFSDWLYNNGARFRGYAMLDDRNALDEGNIEVLWRSLLFDYAKRLSARAPALATANKDKQYSSSIDRIAAATPPTRAPYFVVWFFNKLQGELQLVSQEFQEEQNRRLALRLMAPVALYVAAGAFSYFIFIMFLFLLVSIEASVRRLASAENPALPPLPAASQV
ncbi:hypothetical protein MA20_20405 [Bradyrhizobium japonicum]|uniref:Uncharacterized protein n=1 Tax=Bradyrhizobium japonicum TaxID=375 RepID=A0A0A3XV55_BRAJP|nr:hypothetical protein [Bradyrhizobium japonicum]KGT76996.1 hypothetical protein MA20_20405 [Bradyrhizobium japonicum]MCS3892534.1 putative membrane protein YqjE [Bradyrhizobium japonicum USDA 38]MCS3945048.1 putative membrane protein YqjE [Bradyrhizobium japonicum]MCW2222425.1 putative membrane protein YqjE [Bradyrhizobium japonicum]MCW2347037.1 putative membrane protein YqjE [Bradyrhizobium japonicum]